MRERRLQGLRKREKITERGNNREGERMGDREREMETKRKKVAVRE